MTFRTTKNMLSSSYCALTVAVIAFLFGLVKYLHNIFLGVKTHFLDFLTTIPVGKELPKQALIIGYTFCFSNIKSKGFIVVVYSPVILIRIPCRL